MTSATAVVTDPCLAAALAWAEAGLWPLCLVSPTEGGKRPRAAAWQRRKLTPEQLAASWVPGSNVGLVTGAAGGLCCIDVDPRNGGDAWWQAHKARVLESAVYVERTGSGGIHAVFRHPGGHIASRRGQHGLAPGVELLADGGHQFVVAPSAHASGNAYTILKGEI